MTRIEFYGSQHDAIAGGTFASHALQLWEKTWATCGPVVSQQAYQHIGKCPLRLGTLSSSQD